MLSIRKAYYWIFIYFLIVQALAPALVGFSDELGVLFMLILIALDIAINKNFKRYTSIYCVVGIMAFYAVYSVVALNFNTPKAIANDFIIQLKPYIPFFLVYAIAPEFTPSEKDTIKKTCVVMSVIVVLLGIVSFVNMRIVRNLLGHVAFVGIITTLVSSVYMLMSIDKEGRVSKRDLSIATLMLVGGLTCTRSKFYGEFIFAMYLFYLYKPGVLKRVKIKQLILFCVIFFAIIWAAWEKISFYFLTDGIDGFDEEMLVHLARPALYAGMGMILIDFPLLGSGLASFATYASTPSVNYSEVYRMFDLDKVWGLSYNVPHFICDCFFPELAQFGLIGIAIFILFFAWVYKKMRLLLHTKGKYAFAVAMLIFASVFIEGTTGSAFMQAAGVMQMSILGLSIAQFRNIDKQKAREILASDYHNTVNK